MTKEGEIQANERNKHTRTAPPVTKVKWRTLLQGVWLPPRSWALAPFLALVLEFFLGSLCCLPPSFTHQNFSFSDRDLSVTEISQHLQRCRAHSSPIRESTRECIDSQLVCNIIIILYGCCSWTWLKREEPRHMATWWSSGLFPVWVQELFSTFRAQ